VMGLPEQAAMLGAWAEATDRRQPVCAADVSMLVEPVSERAIATQTTQTQSW
jgi:hypothetical protein